MNDSIYLQIGGKKIRNFISYTAEADLYVADHAFSLVLSNPETEITGGQKCELYVNDQLELTGIVDHINSRLDKSGRTLTVEGRDLMGLIVDSSCEQFISVQDWKLSQLAQLLLKDVPFINLKQVLYQQDIVGKLRSRRSRLAAFGLAAMMGVESTGERIAQIHPGMSKFQVLQMYALSKGLMFYGLPDGTFIFGRPLAGGDPDYTITINKEGRGVNFISAEVDQNWSKRYSKVTVVGQRQAHVDDGVNVMSTNVGGVPGSVSDGDFPFYKPFVQLSYNDSQTPQQHARMIMDKGRHDGFRLVYELPRHSQAGKNYTINRMALIKDDIHNIHGSYLVSGRTFRLDKTKGPTTSITVTLPGLVEDGGKPGGPHK
ncbi:MAG: hypothetical protein M0T70_04415 [Geobacteraceae bacterium]|nr:hypothetical protein [Geobacteraceae bacterium]